MLERAIGFEPMINGFADRRLWPLGYARLGIWRGRRDSNPQFSAWRAGGLTDLPTSSRNGTPRKIGWRGRTRTCINFASSDSKSEMFPLHHSPLELNYLEIMISFTREKLEKAVSDSKSYAEVLRKIGLCQTGNNNQTIKKYISLWKLNVRHFSTQSERAKLYLNKPPKPLESILVRNSSYNRTNLKKRLYDATLKKPICKMCGQNENWQGKQMY